jgi:hypothetical protein
MVYHGIVSRAALDEVYERTGTFFPGPSPDMASAVALSYVVKRHMHIDAPFIVSGQSPKSTGGLGSRHAHVGDLKSLSHLPSNIDEAWDSRIPFLWTGPTIWAQSALQAVRAMEKDKDLTKFRFSYLYAAFVHHALAHRGLLRQLNMPTLTRLAVCVHMAAIAWRRGCRLITNLIRTRLNISSAETIENLNTSYDAFQAINKNLAENYATLPFSLTRMGSHSVQD